VLQISNQSVEDRPAHWVLAELGKEVLRPGGKRLTLDLVEALDISLSDDVIELAPGVGFTARRVLDRNPNSYTAVELDRAAANALEETIGGPDREVVVGHAGNTDLESGSADVVYGEAMLTMQPDDGKAEIATEANRLLRSGGYYGIHELGLTPNDLGEDTKSRIHDDLSDALKVNARPLTQSEWVGILESAGFEVVWQARAPMALLDPARVLQDEGPLQALRIGYNLLRMPGARKRVTGMRAVFDRYDQHLDAVAIVAKKRET